jgi:hypothetical protein
MDFPYLEKVTKLNVAALAALASAPPPPEPKVEGSVSTDTTIRWYPVSANNFRSVEQYVVRWRRTDSNAWTEARPNQNCIFIATHGKRVLEEADKSRCSEVLKGIRVDDWVFGVSSVSKDGFESPVASAVPGGAFEPYVAPPSQP